LNKFKEKVLFYGTPGFAVTSLERLIKEGYNIIGVVTAPDRKSGRGQKIQFSDVKKYALEKDIPVFQPTNLKSKEFEGELNQLNPDVQVVIAFRMLPEKVWNYPSLGTFNVHASLLPKYRGAAPINWAIYNGEKETGVTTFKLKHKIDTGDMAMQLKVEIERKDNFESLHDKLAILGSEAITKTLADLFNNQLELTPQFYEKDKYPEAPKINKTDLILNLDKSALEIQNAIRAFSPYPAARIFFNEKIVKIISVQEALFDKKISDKILYIEDNQIGLSCSDKSLRVIRAQFEGKKAMSAQEIVNGRLL